MHIAFFSPAWPIERYHNGIVTYVHWMRRELEAQGHKVSVFIGIGEPAIADLRVHQIREGLVRRIWRRWRGLWNSEAYSVFGRGAILARSMLSVHRRDPIDVVEMEESFGWSADVQRITGLPVLVKLHGPAFLSLVEEELATPLGQQRVQIEGVALNQAPSLAAPAAVTLSETLVRYHLKPCISEHIVNPMPVTSEMSCWDVRTCDRSSILFVGRFDQRKGGDVMLQAFAILLRARPNLRLLFVGPDYGLMQPDGSRIDIKSYIASLFSPSEASCIDVRGRLPNDQIGAYRTSAMVTVVASRWENQGYAALEAMAHGCPVVASAVGGNPESVINEQTGLLFKPEDPEDLAIKIAFMLDHPNDAARMGASARMHVMQHHSAPKVASDSLAIYRRMIQDRPQR